MTGELMLQGKVLPIHVVAPDYPGFGFSDAPASAMSGGSFAYTSDHLTDLIEDFCKQRDITSFVVYMFDFGAPVGFRLSPIAEMIRLDAKREPEKAAAVRRAALTPQAIKSQYQEGARPERVAPEAWVPDAALHLLDGGHFFLEEQAATVAPSFCAS